MANSLTTGVSGLQSHQKMIEIAGNNLANMNTVGYKSRSAIFSDVLYDTIRGGTSGTSGVTGGTDPVQIGTGSRLAAVRSNMSGGGLESTGSDLDLALDGNGFFVVNNGTNDLFTRAGAFKIDSNGLLVDSSTGYPVQRFGTVGEDNDIYPSFQAAGDSDIHIPIGASVPGKATENVYLSGNLPSNGDLPTNAILETSPWLAGGSAATSSTLINSLDSVTTPYAAGDKITISGTNPDGAAFSTVLSVDNTTTLGDLVSAINSAIPGTTATLEADGSLKVSADDTGKSFLSLTLNNNSGNAGVSTIGASPFLVTQTGKNGQVVTGGVPIYDASGGQHTVNYTITRQENGTWNLDAQIDSSSGTIIDGSIEGITFSSDGTFNSITGTGTGDAKISVLLAGQTVPMSFTISMDGKGTTDGGISSYASDPSISSGQDGYASGSLVSVLVDSSGIIQGVASNGVQFPIAQVAIASFSNPQGLESVGNNFYSPSLSSGDVKYGTAGSSGRGAVRAGQLEQSNVDIAIEFTKLIVAQRGFSANSRTITVTNDILQELTNLIR